VVRESWAFTDAVPAHLELALAILRELGQQSAKDESLTTAPTRAVPEDQVDSAIARRGLHESSRYAGRSVR